MSEHTPVGGGMGATICSCGTTVPTTAFDLHAGIIGYVVMVTRPGAQPEIVSAIGPLEGAQNALESRRKKQAVSSEDCKRCFGKGQFYGWSPTECTWCRGTGKDLESDLVEYVIGAISEVETP